ncbi:MAG: hypothetical protein SFV19_05775 [Rhodospirillaceae bacterium]|nr:hypothetical protein [Rhodospirillaceae bacterium]
MKTTHIIGAALALGLLAGAPVAAMAAPDQQPAVTQSADVDKELAKLKKAVGAGEISNKEYKARKEALLKGTQTAKSETKPN